MKNYSEVETLDKLLDEKISPENKIILELMRARQDLNVSLILKAVEEFVVIKISKIVRKISKDSRLQMQQLKSIDSKVDILKSLTDDNTKMIKSMREDLGYKNGSS